MRGPPKILLLDDDQDLLDLYREILTQLPSKPEIFTSATGMRALAMLESEPFTLLVCDLNMPRMDGLQVLSIVRRKFPELRTVVLTSVLDEQFRSRAYALGVDLFWQKPSSESEIQQFLQSLESLIGRDTQSGFRGMQSKSLVDIIQLECISRNSTTLKITNGALTGKIWIHEGEVIDAVTDELGGEPAFTRILAWKTGNFEALPAEPSRPRVIMNSYQGLLLESAQAIDEAQGLVVSADGSAEETKFKTSALSKFPGAEFVLVLKAGSDKPIEARGLENAQPVSDWMHQSLAQFHTLGERLKAGPLQQMQGLGVHRHVALATKGELEFCVGWEHNLSAGQITDSMKKVLALWGS